MCKVLSSLCATMTCDVRLLNYISLALGLMSFGALSLAVATDYWLFTADPMSMEEMMQQGGMEAGPGGTPPPEMMMGGMGMPGGMDMDSLPMNLTLELPEGMTKEEGDYADLKALDMDMFVIYLHSGLWRACIMDDDSEESPEEGMDPSTRCYSISYFQPWVRRQGGDTTNSILRAIRKSAPSIVISLFILAFALGLCTVGNNKRDYKTLAGAVLYIFSALSLAIGVIFYISAVNDEVSHRKPPSNPDLVFEYHYGWAFFLAGSSFIFSMCAAVTNISAYLRRFSNLDDMVMIIPGLDKKGEYSVSREVDESEYDTGTQNPTIIL